MHCAVEYDYDWTLEEQKTQEVRHKGSLTISTCRASMWYGNEQFGSVSFKESCGVNPAIFGGYSRK